MAVSTCPHISYIVCVSSCSVFQLKQEYDVVKKMRSLSGWGWDDERNAPEVSDEVWDAYTRVSLSYTARLYLMFSAEFNCWQRIYGQNYPQKGFSLL